MKEITKLINANIKNLTSLWETVGISFDSFYKTPDFEYCEIKDSEWPNRLWLDQNITQATIDLIKEKLATIPSNITLPIWNIYDKKEDTILELNGFNLKFEQVGMSLKLDKSFDIKSNVKIQLVTTDTEAKLWSELFIKSFGYKTSSETIIKTLNEINYYIAYHDSLAVGTAIMHKTNNVMGIHSVGIPPEMRRRGYAEQIMKLLINIAVENRNEYITLQASNMGKNLYLKLGFEEQFLIKNYVLQQCF
jgi:ribosomal protein S18 acetylase RimI-like enzyme